MKKILIIEDDQIVANIYRNKLAVEGYKVELAHDGESGLQTIRDFRPDAVLLDLMLPKVTGVDLMKKVRATPEFEKLPIIVFSNTYLTNMVQEAWKAGATKCLSKANCSPKQVIDVVRNLTSNGSTPTPAGQPAGQKASPAPAPRHSSAHVQASSQTRHFSPAQDGIVSSDPDAEFQAELRKSFIESLPATLGTLRSVLQSLVKGGDEITRLKQVHELYRRIHALTGNAAVTGMFTIAQMADALEALLKELYEKPKNITPSTLRTVASAVDFMGILFEHGIGLEQSEPAPANVLVVDDEAISRRAVTYALEKAKLKSVNVEDPQVAYNLLMENRFDLIFLDVDMPQMNGYELCAKLRELPAHKKTPVIFVTSLNDFEARANSTMSGGNDFIAKPFLFIELAVKALVFLLRSRYEAGQKL